MPVDLQDSSPRQPKWPLRTAIGVRYNYYIQLVAIERAHVPKLAEGWKLVTLRAARSVTPDIYKI